MRRITNSLRVHESVDGAAIVVDFTLSEDGRVTGSCTLQPSEVADLIHAIAPTLANALPRYVAEGWRGEAREIEAHADSLRALFRDLRL